MVKNNRKYGFSMLEALVTMLMVAIFTAAASNLFTQKFKPVKHTVAHGSFECYYSNRDVEEPVLDEEGNPTGAMQMVNKAVLCQRMGREGIYQPEECNIGTFCTFRAVKEAEYYVVNAIGGGGGGCSENQKYGGSAGQYRSFYLPSISNELRITPGLGGTKGNNSTATSGGETIITDNTGTVLMTAAGGKKGFSHIHELQRTLKATDILGCSIQFDSTKDDDGNLTSAALQKCALSNNLESEGTASCVLNTQGFTVSYCVRSEYVTLDGSTNHQGSLITTLEDDGTLLIRYRNGNMNTSGVSAWLYPRTEVLNFNRTTSEDPSKLDEYLTAVGMAGEVNISRAGVGGKGTGSAENGTSGAVFIIW